MAGLKGMHWLRVFFLRVLPCQPYRLPKVKMRLPCVIARAIASKSGLLAVATF